MTCPPHTIPTPVELNYPSKMRVSNVGVTSPGITIRQPDGSITDLSGNRCTCGIYEGCGVCGKYGARGEQIVKLHINDESPETVARRHAETEGVI